MTQEQTEDEICEKMEGWTHEDVGKRIPERKTSERNVLQRAYCRCVLPILCDLNSSAQVERLAVS